jgi:hypothetical protein
MKRSMIPEDLAFLRGGSGPTMTPSGVTSGVAVMDGVHRLNVPSWPGLSRPSTSSFHQRGKDVDARDKPGHDDL